MWVLNYQLYSMCTIWSKGLAMCQTIRLAHNITLSFEWKNQCYCSLCCSLISGNLCIVMYCMTWKIKDLVIFLVVKINGCSWTMLLHYKTNSMASKRCHIVLKLFEYLYGFLIFMKEVLAHIFHLKYQPWVKAFKEILVVFFIFDFDFV